MQTPMTQIATIMRKAGVHYLFSDAERVPENGKPMPSCGLELPHGYDFATDSDGFICLVYSTMCTCIKSHPDEFKAHMQRYLIRWQKYLGVYDIESHVRESKQGFPYLWINLNQNGQPLFYTKQGAVTSITHLEEQN